MGLFKTWTRLAAGRSHVVDELLTLHADGTFQFSDLPPMNQSCALEDCTDDRGRPINKTAGGPIVLGRFPRKKQFRYQERAWWAFR